MIRIDCFAYHKKIGKPCYALDKLYCKNQECSFYRKETVETNIESIEKDIVEYEVNRTIKGVSLI